MYSASLVSHTLAAADIVITLLIMTKQLAVQLEQNFT
jgi:hypothetical protein